MDGLSFVNGMEMSPNGEFLLLCETGRARIHKYYLKGNTLITKLFFRYAG
jgi:sugar lactone lactonase YvrE